MLKQENARWTAGLVSVSFRDRTPREIAEAAVSAGLSAIEWGSDVHAPKDDLSRLREIAALQKDCGLTCCSYGTYFRIGTDDPDELHTYIQAARILETGVLRLWCGSRSPRKTDPEERSFLLKQCRTAARIAEEEQMTLCLECHRGTFTQTAEGALFLMEGVKSPRFRMYWQPEAKDPEQNLVFARALSPYTRHLHVFARTGEMRRPLAEATDEWIGYLSAFPGRHCLLLEFMPDSRLASLPQEAEALRRIMEGAERERNLSVR